MHTLRYDAHILHGDVSYANIMWQKKDEDESARFIIHDFDRAVPSNTSNTSSGQTAKYRTSTLSFMAFELLRDMHDSPGSPGVMHELHHGYESLFWVAVWSTLKSEPKQQVLGSDTVLKKRIKDAESKSRVQAAVSEWERGTHDIIASYKKGLLTENEDFCRLPFPPHCQLLGRFLWKVGGVFRRARFVMNEAYDGNVVESADVLRELITRSEIKTSVSEARAALLMQ